MSATFPNHKERSFVAFIPNVSSPWNLSSQNSGNPTDEKAQKHDSCSKWKPPWKQGLLDQLRTVYISSQTLKQNVQDLTCLHQVFCICTIASGLVLSWDSWVCEQVDLWFLYLIFFPFHYVALSCQSPMWWLMFYLIVDRVSVPPVL